MPNRLAVSSMMGSFWILPRILSMERGEWPNRRAMRSGVHPDTDSLAIVDSSDDCGQMYGFVGSDSRRATT